VEAIYNSAGTLVARYIYDAWGGIISIQNASGTEITNQDHIAHRNPFRYRGYYYDAETGLYYLNSRYYDPVVGRFVSADGLVAGVGGDVRGYNLYAYCMNNPVNLSDEAGNWPAWATKAGNWIKEKAINAYNTVKGWFEDTDSQIALANKSQNQRPDTGLRDIPDDEISKGARDKSLPKDQRNRYKTEEKVRGSRNKQKRSNPKIVFVPPAPEVVLGSALIVVSSVAIAFVFADDVAGVVVDDVLLIPLFEAFAKGTELAFGGG